MIRQIIHIDEEKCNGCGACAAACHEGAIAIIDGKAKLLRDDYCDGMGDCLPECPMGAITFEDREAAAYDEKAAAERKAQTMAEKNVQVVSAESENAAASRNSEEPGIGHDHVRGGGCPGARVRDLKAAGQDGPTAWAPLMPGKQRHQTDGSGQHPVHPVPPVPPTSELRNWPPQIRLAPLKAPYFDGAKLLIAADCTAYSYAAFHQEFMRGKVTLIGCPKLDAVDYSEKLTEIIRQNDIKSVTILRMEVPCCGGLEMAAKKALQASGKFIPWQVVTVSIDGRILD